MSRLRKKKRPRAVRERGSDDDGESDEKVLVEDNGDHEEHVQLPDRDYEPEDVRSAQCLHLTAKDLVRTVLGPVSFLLRFSKLVGLCSSRCLCDFHLRRLPRPF